jgi:hypothetical protein
MSETDHPRSDPNGSRAPIKLPEGITHVDELRYKQQLWITVNGQPRSAVVDLIVPRFWGGPEAAFSRWDSYKKLYHVMIKLVWQDPEGDWEESREVREATEAEFLQWRSEFKENAPPTPMPFGYV